MNCVPLNRCWYRINIDVTNALQKKKFPFYNPKENKVLIWRFKSHEIFDPTWLHYIRSIGLLVSGVMVFYRPAGSSSDLYAHIDKYSDKTLVSSALNWVIDGRDSEMVWYKTPTDVSTKSFKLTMANTKYVNWPITELVEIDRKKIESELTLVRVDVPHAIKMGDGPRLCISVRLINSYTLRWNSVVDLMKSKGLLIGDPMP